MPRIWMCKYLQSVETHPKFTGKSIQGDVNRRKRCNRENSLRVGENFQNFQALRRSV